MARNKADLQRRGPSRQPKRRFIVYCEGKNTEPAYFDALKRILRYGLIEIKTFPVGPPMTVAERAVERAEREGLAKGSRKPKNSFAAHDQVWAVFDRDTHDYVEEAAALCHSKGVRVGRSNPCFELWLVLHFVDHDAPDDSRQLARRLHKLHPAYDPDGAKVCAWEVLMPNIAAAEDRAAGLLRKREQERNPNGRPSTTVGQLTAAIREAAIAAKRR